MANNAYIKSVYDKSVVGFHQGKFETPEYHDMKLSKKVEKTDLRRKIVKKQKDSGNKSFNSVDIDE